jgi:DNA-binding MarR family transcriptional regulator
MAANRQSAQLEIMDATPLQQERLQGIAGYLADDAAAEFDRLIYERIRLGIMSALMVNASLSFGELKELLKTSDGNLSTHARKLEEAKYIAVKKTFENRVPKTVYRLSDKGRRAFERYLNHMEALIKASRGH